MHPVERLLNLVALLLESSRPLTFAQIRDQLSAYGQEDVAAAKRMFERDKDLLREIGIPVELAGTDVWDVEEGYTIPKDRYYLPDVEFTPVEMSALFVAAHSPGPDMQAEQAALKLQAGSKSGLGVLAGRALAAGPDQAGPRLLAVAEATLAHRSIRFRYRPATGEPSERHVDPHALVWRTGHWYAVGMDRDRGESRSFRLSRFLSDVKDAGEGSPPPEGFDARAQLKAGPWGIGEPTGEARVAVSPDVAWWVVPATPGAKVLDTREDDWVEVSVPGGSEDALVSWVLSFGPDVVALAPDTLKAAVVAALEAILASS